MEESDNPSMEEILQTIRGVIAGEIQEDKDDDVLELTEIATEEDDEPADGDRDVLNSIDDALKQIETQDEPQAAPTLPEEPSFIEPVAELTEQEEEIIVSKPAENGNDGWDLEEIEEHAVAEKPVTPKQQKDPIAAAALQTQHLLSDDKAELSSQALRELINHIPKQDPHFRSGTTLEDLTIEALRPYLSNWLDNHLPGLVERLVEKEIRRLVPEEE